jgi:hypothetical protein
VVVGVVATLPVQPWSSGSAAAEQATVRIVGVPASVPPGGGPFQVLVEVEGVTNLGAYEWWVAYDPAIIELTDPPASAMSDAGFLGSTGRTIVCPAPILPPDMGLQPGNVRFGCGTMGLGPGVDGDGVLSTITFVPVAGGAVDIEFVCAGLSDPFGNEIPVSNVPACLSPVTPTPTPDSDGDGCTDAEEAAMGFNPTAWYDFYDVPVPAYPDPTPNGPKNHAVTIGDVLAVLFYVGTSDNEPPNANGVDYDSDKDGDTVEDGLAYDRTDSPLPNPPWDAGIPNGPVSMVDVLAALAQIGLSCASEP